MLATIGPLLDVLFWLLGVGVVVAALADRRARRRGRRPPGRVPAAARKGQAVTRWGGTVDTFATAALVVAVGRLVRDAAVAWQDDRLGVRGPHEAPLVQTLGSLGAALILAASLVPASADPSRGPSATGEAPVVARAPRPAVVRRVVRVMQFGGWALVAGAVVRFVAA